MTNMLQALILLCLSALYAEPMLSTDLGGPDGDPDDLPLELDREETDEDLNLLRTSHLSEIFKWPGVRGKDAKEEGRSEWTHVPHPQYRDRVLVRPDPGSSIATVVNIPEPGRYRVWLSYLTKSGERHPVTLSLEGRNRAQHLFGGTSMPQKGAAEVEEELPVRFDTETDRDSYLLNKVIVWEYWGLSLKPGSTVLRLSSSDKGALLDAFFITRSERYAPGGSRVLGEAGALNHIYYRFRVSVAERKPKKVKLSGAVAYIVPPTTLGPYHAGLEAITSQDGEAEIPVGEWSAWLDATEATTTKGQYVNAGLEIETARRSPLADGALEIQNAWYPHPGAIIGAVRTSICDGESRALFPALWKRFASPACPEPGEGVAGTFGVRFLKESQQLRTHRQELEREIAQIPPESLKEGVMPRRIRVMTLSRVPPSDYDLAIPLLKKTGFNFLRKIFPNIRTMANYSPYTVFYLGAGMDRSQNSFALPRANACTGHWGEDWMAPTGVTSMAGVQTESFMASVLRCGASRHRQPFGFYMVWKLGDLDRKLAPLVSHGVKIVYAYYWGPRYFGGGSPESSSHRVWSYAQLNRACRALGPADEIIAEGKREPAQVALLYNRTDEMWNDGGPWGRTDRIYAFLALRHAHVPVDLVLEDDLCDETLQQFKVLYLNGTNLRRDALQAVARWVEQGGLLHAASGTAMRDEYDDPLPEAVELFGAVQRPGGASEGSQEVYQPLLAAHEPIDTVTIESSPLTPAIEVPVVGVRTVLLPKGGRPVAHYADGSCAGIYREHGKGKVLLLGVMPGYLYAHNAPRDEQNHPVNYTGTRRAIIAAAALSGHSPSVTYSKPLVEVSRFDRETGLAIIVTDLSYQPGKPGILSVRTGRKIGAVSASLAGPLKWRRNGNRIEIEFPVPSPVDVVILRQAGPEAEPEH